MEKALTVSLALIETKKSLQVPALKDLPPGWGFEFLVFCMNIPFRQNNLSSFNLRGKCGNYEIMSI